MLAPMTAAQIACEAEKIVLSTLPHDHRVMETLKLTELPIMYSGTVIIGPASDGTDELVEYPSTWAGLATSSSQGRTLLWFIYNCQLTNERAWACLGQQPNIRAAITAAVQKVQEDISHWSSVAAAA